MESSLTSPAYKLTLRKVQNTHASTDTVIYCAQAAMSSELYSDGVLHRTQRQRQNKDKREGERQRNILWALKLIHCSELLRTYTTEEITYVIHEHDDNVWRRNIWWLFCQGTTYCCTKENQSCSGHRFALLKSCEHRLRGSGLFAFVRVFGAALAHTQLSNCFEVFA